MFRKHSHSAISDKEVEMTSTTVRQPGATRNHGALRRRTATMLVTLVVAATAALLTTANAAQAQPFGPGNTGNITLGGNCYLSQGRANLGVAVMNPQAYQTTGLYYYVEYWAKPAGVPGAVFTRLAGGYTGLINTWSRTFDSITNSTSWDNSLTTISSTPMYGTPGASYDVLVRYWYAAPGGYWAGPYGLQGGFTEWSNFGGNHYGATYCTI